VKASVYVRLKKEVLDVQGRAVERALETLGISGVREVRVGKLIEIELEGAAGPELDANLQRACTELLSNPVIEDYEIVLGPD
jgi:phosphoribosylformylglycinamidine synthase subunit PurS